MAVNGIINLKYRFDVTRKQKNKQTTEIGKYSNKK